MVKKVGSVGVTVVLTLFVLLVAQGLFRAFDRVQIGPKATPVDVIADIIIRIFSSTTGVVVVLAVVVLFVFLFVRKSEKSTRKKK
jgi:cell division protein FtsW (lipid II flippase)